MQVVFFNLQLFKPVVIHNLAFDLSDVKVIEIIWIIHYIGFIIYFI